MDGCTISRAAAQTGFTTSAPRFYEGHGLVEPGRSATGYRVYTDADIDRLRFIGRAKGFGLTLDEITDVLPLLDDDRCSPVQDHLRSLVDEKIDEAQAHVAELVAFTAELQRAAAVLRQPAPDGPCDASCGCIDGSVAHGSSAAAPVTLGAKPAGDSDNDAAESWSGPPIACTLAPDRVPDRVGEWQSVVREAVRREPLPDGVRVQFPPAVDVARIAGLAAAEQGCCSFFTFRLTLTATGVSLDVTGPPGSRPVIDALVGVAA